MSDTFVIIIKKVSLL